jgi:hypothetical protein
MCKTEGKRKRLRDEVFGNDLGMIWTPGVRPGDPPAENI